MIDASRGSPAVQAFFIEAFEGTLVTDFYRVYDSVRAASYRKCFPHLLRELVRVDQKNETAAWQAFSKKLRRFLQDALRHPSLGILPNTGKETTSCRTRQNSLDRVVVR